MFPHIRENDSQGPSQCAIYCCIFQSDYIFSSVRVVIDGLDMARVFCVATAIAIAVALVIPANAADPTGTWLIQDGTAKVSISPCGETICGNVVWLSQPIDAATGRPQTDKLNADPQLRDRPMLGVAIFLNLQRNNEESKWLGRIYNPDDGNTYDGSIELVGPMRLKVDGCVLIYCQSEFWTRIK